MFKFIIIPLTFLLSIQPAWSFDHNHKTWNDILKKYVLVQGNTSLVQYKKLKENSTNLESYTKTLSSIKKDSFDSWNKKQQQSFLINAYNAFTLKLILNHYPIKSIKKIGSFFSSPWKKKFFSLFGKQISLDHIEHKLIRGNKKLNNAHVHFSVVCASIGCPMLQNRAFTDKNIQTLFKQGAMSFLSDSSRNRYDSNKKTLYLSKIFKWYKDDFIKTYGSVHQFVAPYITKIPEEQVRISNKKVRLEYTDYNWNLNEIK